jgi:hypothetical protein
VIEGDVLRQRNWTDAELQSAQFKHYDPRKRLVMAKVLRTSRTISITMESLLATAGDIICYDPGGTQARPNTDDYDHWPVRKDLFKQNYKPWDEKGWRPNGAEAHLIEHGCRPYYKAAGIWARRLRRGVVVQSLESPEPLLVPPGRWLCIGSQGEPYHMSDDKFRARYLTPEESAAERLYWRLIKGLSELRFSSNGKHDDE